MTTDLNFDHKFEFQNSFYLTCDNSRIAKLIAQYKIFKQTLHVPGVIVEFGIFIAASFMRLAAFRELTATINSKKLIGFDIFGKCPNTMFEPDKKRKQAFTDEAGKNSLNIDELTTFFTKKNICNYELVVGDIVQTVPEYCLKKTKFAISFLHIDVDIYEPSKVMLESFYPHLEEGVLF